MNKIKGSLVKLGLVSAIFSSGALVGQAYAMQKMNDLYENQRIEFEKLLNDALNEQEDEEIWYYIGRVNTSFELESTSNRKYILNSIETKPGSGKAGIDEEYVYIYDIYSNSPLKEIPGESIFDNSLEDSNYMESNITFLDEVDAKKLL